jgi:hypothetical protein
MANVNRLLEKIVVRTECPGNVATARVRAKGNALMAFAFVPGIVLARFAAMTVAAVAEALVHPARIAAEMARDAP